MFGTHNQAVYELLRARPRITIDDLASLQEEQRASARSLADLAIERGLIDRSELLASVAHATGAEYLPELPATIPPDTLAWLTPALARSYRVLPLRTDARRIDVLAVDPLHPRLVEELSFALDREVRLVVSDPTAIEALIGQHYGDDDATLDELLKELDDAGAMHAPDEELSTNDIAALAGQPPVVRFVNLVLGQAIRDNASDIHFEPFESDFKIRYRIDGVLYEMAPPSHALALPITSRIKVLANLDIAERRTPQDGRIRLTLAARPVDLRVSTLPTQFGESVVLRVLDQAAVQLDLTQLGMPADILRGVEESIRRPNGIFIVTGPTGSGKTTTLYSALRAISTPDLKVLTAEDPVEYELDGIMQVPVVPAHGLTFASVLRAFLRQDPDVIMVGEIRDLETAQIAIQASLTGHLVLSTLHTNDAAGAVTRLVDMGVEPFLIASSIEAVLAQRLVRRVCDGCRKSYEPERGLLEQLGLSDARFRSWRFSFGAGCKRCGGTGYRGRTGIYEWLRMNESLRQLVLENSPTLAIRKSAIAAGMQTLRDAGLRAVLDGATTVDEILRCT